MIFVVRLKILALFFLLPRIANSYEFLSISDEHRNFIIDICKLYRTKSIIFLYAHSTKEMEMKTTMVKWTRALSREGFTTTSFYFSEMINKSSYYVNQIVRPHYIAIISNVNDINEFSLATSTFDMSFAVWLVLFIYKGHNLDYCHNPPGNIFHLRFDSEMLVRCGDENILREWYSIDIDWNRTEIDDLGYWNIEKGITNIASNSLYERRHNLQGYIMKAVLVKSSPTIYINEAGKLDGLLGRMLREVSNSLNFSVKIVSMVETYGKWDPIENTWTGAIGELYSGRADICFSSFTMTNARSNVIDFTYPLVNCKYFLYIKEPKIFAFKWSSYFQTFSRSIWIAISGLLIVATILLIFLKIRDENNRNIGQLLSDNFLEVWGIFCQQGVSDIPNRFSLRIAYFSIFLLGVILSAAYSASLTSFLTTGIYKLPFNSLESFVEDGTYQLSVLRDTAEYDMLLNSSDPLEKKMMKLMLDEEKLSILPIDGFKQVCDNPKLALYLADVLKDVIVSKIPCDIVGIETGRVQKSAMILSKNNPFTDVFNFHLLKFINRGMNNRLKNLTSKMKSNDMIENQPIEIKSVISLIFFIVIGVISSTFILIIEKYFFVS